MSCLVGDTIVGKMLNELSRGGNRWSGSGGEGEGVDKGLEMLRNWPGKSKRGGSRILGSPSLLEGTV